MFENCVFPPKFEWYSRCGARVQRSRNLRGLTLEVAFTCCSTLDHAGVIQAFPYLSVNGIHFPEQLLRNFGFV